MPDHSNDLLFIQTCIWKLQQQQWDINAIVTVVKSLTPSLAPSSPPPPPPSPSDEDDNKEDEADEDEDLDNETVADSSMRGTYCI
jgi:hypothetical protein